MELPKRPNECHLVLKLFLSLQCHYKKTFNGTFQDQFNWEIRILHQLLDYLEFHVISFVDAGPLTIKQEQIIVTAFVSQILIQLYFTLQPYRSQK